MRSLPLFLLPFCPLAVLLCHSNFTLVQAIAWFVPHSLLLAHFYFVYAFCLVPLPRSAGQGEDRRLVLPSFPTVPCSAGTLANSVHRAGSGRAAGSLTRFTTFHLVLPLAYGCGFMPFRLDVTIFHTCLRFPPPPLLPVDYHLLFI
jgi:hypothetical protein